MKKLRSFVKGYLGAEKLKGLIMIPQYKRMNRFKLYALGATAALLLCACLLQLSTLSEHTRQPAAGLVFRSSQQVDPPPESECPSSSSTNSTRKQDTKPK